MTSLFRLGLAGLLCYYAVQCLPNAGGYAVAAGFCAGVLVMACVADWTEPKDPK
jgi:hypothetical protein